MSSAAVVDFIAGLMPLYDGEHLDRIWCALLIPLPASGNDDPDNAFIRVRWQGEAAREQIVSGCYVATLAVVRYVQFHATGQPAERTAAELAHMSQHFTFKTGCTLNLHYDVPGRDLVPPSEKHWAGWERAQ